MPYRQQAVLGMIPLDFSQTAATLDPVSHYWSGAPHRHWSLLLSTPTVGASIDVVISATNDITPTALASRTYTDVTNDIYGQPIVLTSAAPVVIIVDTPIVFGAFKITFDSDIAATWVAKGMVG